MHSGLPQLEHKPATLFSEFHFDPHRLRSEAEIAIAYIREMQRAQPDLNGWVTFFLGNQSGDHNDLRLSEYAGHFRPTSLGAGMPYTMDIIERLNSEGFSFQYCRIALLEPRSLLRCHVDMYTSHRLIVPLTEQGDDFRHVFEEDCFGMRVGELWGIDGNVCHGAAHVGSEGYRVCLLLDAKENDKRLPGWWQERWQIPATRMIQRSNWEEVARRRTATRAEALIEDGRDAAAAEQEWLFVPFEYVITPSAAYDELIRFCEERAGTPDADRSFWTSRASHWRQRSCRCV